MKRTAFIAFVFVTIVYIFLGSLVFHYVEKSNEKEERKAYAVDHKKFLEAHKCLSQEALEEYLAQVMTAKSRGVPVLSMFSTGNNATNGSLAEDDSNWDMVSTVLFSLTVVSTIGYGNLSPKTNGGQAFCIIFALIGIPLFATSLVGVGERLQIPLKRLKKWKPWYKDNPKKDEQLKTGVFLTSGMCLLIFIPSFVLSRTEDWSYIEALYFCIITLTTVGFGDYIPGRSRDRVSFYLHRIVLCLWILLGLSWVALILSELASLIKEQIVEAARKTSSKFGDLEDIVKKKAKDARDKLAQKASNHWRKRSCQIPGEVYRLSKDQDSQISGVAEEVDLEIEDDVHVLRSTRQCSTKLTNDDRNGIPGVNTSLDSVNSNNTTPNIGDAKDNDIIFPSEEKDPNEEAICRVDVR